MITLEDYFEKTSKIEEPSPEVVLNATGLLERVNALLLDCAPIEAADVSEVNSGWRPAAYNATVKNAKPGSKHITGNAVDVRDTAFELADFLFHNKALLEKHQLWMEHPLATRGWVHLQDLPPNSGNRFFYP